MDLGQLGRDQDRAIFAPMVLRPRPADGADFTVAEPVDIAEDVSFASVSEIDPFLASVVDQDTEIMRWQREVMYASDKGAQTLSLYQQSRIRHRHDTIDKYLEGLK